MNFLQFVFKTRACKERTIHEELAKNVTGLLKSNDSTTIKQVLKVKNLKMILPLVVRGSLSPLESDRIR